VVVNSQSIDEYVLFMWTAERTSVSGRLTLDEVSRDEASGLPARVPFKEGLLPDWLRVGHETESRDGIPAIKLLTMRSS
jgi:hypothetical protein